MPKSKPLSLTITRTFNAPRALVWKAWTDDAMLRKWSCPNGFEIIFSEGELKVGGKFRSTMKSAQFEGTVVGVYKEIDEPKKLVFTHTWEQEGGGHDEETVVTVELSDEDGKTQMIFTQTGFISAGSRDGHEGGWSECFDKLSLQLSH